MVLCTKCKYGCIEKFYDPEEDAEIPILYCTLTQAWVTMDEAKDDIPCEGYEHDLDDDY